MDINSALVAFVDYSARNVTLLAVAFCMGLVNPVGAVTVTIDSAGDPGATFSYDNEITTVSEFSRAGDDTVLTFSTPVGADGLPQDFTVFQITSLAGGAVTLTETITNSGADPLKEWVEQLFALEVSEDVSVSWGSPTASVAGSWTETLIFGQVPALTFNFSELLLPNQSVTLTKVINYSGPMNDPLSGVQTVSFGAALPIPSALILFGSAIMGLGLLGRRRWIQIEERS